MNEQGSGCNFCGHAQSRNIFTLNMFLAFKPHYLGQEMCKCLTGFPTSYINNIFPLFPLPFICQRAEPSCSLAAWFMQVPRWPYSRVNDRAFSAVIERTLQAPVRCLILLPQFWVMYWIWYVLHAVCQRIKRQTKNKLGAQTKATLLCVLYSRSMDVKPCLYIPYAMLHTAI